MSRRNIGFGNEPRTEVPYEEYVGKWARIYLDSGEVRMGKVSEVEQEALILTPHLGVRSSPEWGPIFKMFYTRIGLNIPMAKISSVGISNQYDALNHAKFMNDQQIKGVKRSNNQDNQSK